MFVEEAGGELARQHGRRNLAAAGGILSGPHR
jgi:hypothetical protein